MQRLHSRRKAANEEGLKSFYRGAREGHEGAPYVRKAVT